MLSLWCLSGHNQYLRHTVSIGNGLPWLYINFFQSLWLRCIIIESGIFPSWVSRGVERGDSMFLKKGGMKKERGTDITNFVLINQLTWKISYYDWNALFKKYCYFYSNNFKFCAVKKNYSRYIKKATRKIKRQQGNCKREKLGSIQAKIRNTIVEKTV